MSLGRRGWEGKVYLIWGFFHHSSLFLVASKLNQSSPARVGFAWSSFLSLLSHEHFHLFSSPFFLLRSGNGEVWWASGSQSRITHWTLLACSVARSRSDL